MAVAESSRPRETIGFLSTYTVSAIVLGPKNIINSFSSPGDYVWCTKNNLFCILQVFFGAICQTSFFQDGGPACTRTGSRAEQDLPAARRETGVSYYCLLFLHSKNFTVQQRLFCWFCFHLTCKVSGSVQLAGVHYGFLLQRIFQSH